LLTRSGRRFSPSGTIERVLALRETMLFIFPPGARITVTYRPRTGYMYLVFGLTMGKVRDYATGDVLTTDDYGFWHRATLDG